jgi:peroxin-11B
LICVVGRDKALRLIQYFSRFYAWYLFRTNHAQASIMPFETAKKQIGSARKLLRFGKFVEHFKAAAVLSDKKDIDPVLKFLGVSRQLGYAGYLTFDNLCVLDATGIRKFEKAKDFSKKAQTFWILGLASSILSGTYTLYGLKQRKQKVDKKEGEGVVESKKIEKYASISGPTPHHHPLCECVADNWFFFLSCRQWNTTRLQLVSDLCDICLPSTSLGYLSLDDGQVGLAGTFSSLIGLYNAWEKVRQ